jgi:hypothetical protein
MKRLLIILMLLVAPLQTGLAAVCGYCSHAARDAGDPHVLVHGKSPAKQAGDVVADAEPASAAGDGECALCHLGCGSAVTESAVPPAVQLAAQAPALPSVVYDPSHVDRIDRVPLLAARSF